MGIEEENGIRKVKIREPYGKIYDNGIFTIDFNKFYEDFTLLEINYFKPDLVIIPINISKEEASKCQFIQIVNDFDDNEIYINFYQKSYIYSYFMLKKKIWL